MKVIPDKYDFRFTKSPTKLKSKFDCVTRPKGNVYRYVARAKYLQWEGNLGFSGYVSIVKWRNFQFKLFGWNIWVPVRLLATDGKSYIPSTTREQLTKKAVNSGVIFSEALLDKVLGPIEQRLLSECRSIEGQQEFSNAKLSAVA